MLKVYVASSLHNKANVNDLYKYLGRLGHTITYDWTTHGGVNDPEALKSICLKEFNGVVDCDLLIMLMPARLGSHVELGVALALARPVIIVTDSDDFEIKSFYYMDNVHMIDGIDRLEETINKIMEQEND